MSNNTSTIINEPSGTNEETNKEKINKYLDDEIKEPALTNILEVVKWELKEDEENFNLLPLSDFQKEELLFDYLKNDDDKKELYKIYNNIRSIYDINKEKTKKYETLYNIMENEIKHLENYNK